MRARLTTRQREVLDVIRLYIDANDYAPSFRDIGTSLGITVYGVVCHLDALERKGAITRDKGVARSIRLLGVEG